MNDTETTVTWHLPDWAAGVIKETLETDVDNYAFFDAGQRKDIQHALEAIEEVEG